MCGLIGIVAHSPVNQALYDGLTMLQHRGQDAAGIATCEDKRLFLCRDKGLVRDVFSSRRMVQLQGKMGIGHVRYPTRGDVTSAEAQPFYVNSPYGLTLAHNGQLTNGEMLKQELFRSGLRHMNTGSDSEVLLNVLADELQRAGGLRLGVREVFRAMKAVYQRCRGGYAAVAMIVGRGILAFRDPHGIRPLMIGKRRTRRGLEYAVASESIAIDILGFERERDLYPGEAVYISAEGQIHSYRYTDADCRLSPCLFEFVYLARPDSIMDGISVYKARMHMGETLAERMLRERSAPDVDVIIPVPDTSRTAALSLAYKLGVRYREGLVKNRYIPRTFIMPGQSVRQQSVRRKLNVIDMEFRDKNVLLVDDSIVRGTTSREIVQMARSAGARKVYLASAAPPICYPNFYGIDIPSRHDLIAHDRSPEQICQELGADRLIYQCLEELVEGVRRGNPGIERFDASCFDGNYVTGDIDLSEREQKSGRQIQLDWSDAGSVGSPADRASDLSIISV